MPRRRKDHPLNPGDHEAIVAYLRNRLPPGFQVMIIGNAALQIRGVRAAATVDLDVVLVGSRGVAPAWHDLLGLASAIDPNAQPAQDRASVLLRVPTATGPAEVDLICGRRRPGRFLTRDFLDAVAADAETIATDLVPREEALAVMKAWAVVDQERRASASHPQPGHDEKRRRFLADLGLLRDASLSRDAGFDQARLRAYLARVRPATTRRSVRRLLIEEGALVG